MTTYENDRQGGRQLAWLLLVVTLLAIGIVAWLVSAGEGAYYWAPILLAAATTFAFIKPVIAIRFVTGRLAEIWEQGAARAGLDSEKAGAVRETIAAVEGGNPIEVVAAERLVKNVRTRKRLGKLAMLGGIVAIGVGIPFGSRIPAQVFTLGAAAFLVGLVLWYRNL
jgi:hypothetical protein